MSKLRVGIIGCGRISRQHVGGYSGVDEVEVVAGADPIAEVLQKFGEELGVKNLYADYKEMLASEKLDIVSVCTWPPMHRQMVIDAAEAGVKIIFCEKPVATNLKETDEMIAACKRAGTQLVVNHQRRYLPPFKTAKDLIDAGEIGELEQIQVISIGDLLTDASHSIDLLRFYNNDNPVKTVFAAIDISTVEMRYGHIKENRSLLSLEFENGVGAFVETGSRSIFAYQRFLITGSTGRIDVKGDMDMRLILQRDGKEPTEMVVGEKEKERHEPFEMEVREALEILNSGAGTHRLGADSSRATLEIITAAFESARLHRQIELPVTANDFPLEHMIDQDSVLPEIELARRQARLGH